MPGHAARLDYLPPYIFAVLGDRLREMETQGIDVVRLDVGSPDMPPAEHVIEALHRSACNPDNHGYSGYRGIPRFRQAVSRYYQRRFDVKINADKEVLPLLGSKEGIINLCLAYLDRGDLVLIPDIGYPSYMQGARLAGADIYWVQVSPENGYLPDLSRIPDDVAQRAKMLWVNYPNNPTGATADLDFYKAALEYCVKHDILLASDNPYVDVTFDGYVAPSALQVPDSIDYTVEFMSFSKSYNMAGWRLGAAVGSSKALNTLLRIKSNMDSGHFNAIFDAGIDALDNTPQSWLDERNMFYQRRRDRLLAALPEIGLTADKPAGSLYLWAKPTVISASTYVEQALNEAHVSLAPGGAYGPGGEDFLRISVGISDERLDESINRLKAWYSSHHYA
ncbi:MAG TPA: aminotransferase class I/II-fold pyridoxal phosphate-dependent enzyme [Phototrophicaceae bacterium]|jgi:LL-diaminopimelate aminotransferase|nr:aminotransferase class I/II-fold pyridoxal phosphate-dependent enzyme [Phototrophicaceae bacterium]